MRLFQGVEQNHLAGLVWFNEKASKDWEPQDDPAALSAFRSSLPQYLNSSPAASTSSAGSKLQGRSCSVAPDWSAGAAP